MQSMLDSDALQKIFDKNNIKLTEIENMPETIRVILSEYLRKEK
ncbi:hypothetical protein [Nitrosopumilus sp.]|nr:hypothetical protein [Nitrosopumilus sp.]